MAFGSAKHSRKKVAAHTRSFRQNGGRTVSVKVHVSREILGRGGYSAVACVSSASKDKSLKAGMRRAAKHVVTGHCSRHVDASTPTMAIKRALAALSKSIKK